MKNALKRKQTYFLAVPLAIFGTGIPFAVWGICYVCGYKNFPYWMLLAILGFVLILTGLIWGDLSESIYRKKNNLFSESDIPSEVRQKNINIKTPWILAGLVVLLVLAVFAMIYFFSKSWPLL